MTEGRFSFRGFFLKHWGLKLLSLVFAILLWMFVVGEKRSEVSLSVPIELTGIPDNLVIVSRLPDAVRVRLNGPRTLLSAISPHQLSVALDLKDIQAGLSTFENLPSRLNLPKRIEVTYISPATITIEADQKARKVLPIRVRFKGDLRPGFHLGHVQVDPAEVEVEGAERVLRVMKEVPTEVVDLAGLDQELDRAVDLSFPDPTLRRTSRGVVEIHVGVVEERTNREFELMKVEVPGSRWVAVPPTVTVRVEGGARTLSRLSRTDVTVLVEGGSRAAGRGLARVVARVPKGVKVLEVTPRVVELRAVKGAPSAAEESGDADAPGGGKGD